MPKRSYKVRLFSKQKFKGKTYEQHILGVPQDIVKSEKLNSTSFFARYIKPILVYTPVKWKGRAQVTTIEEFKAKRRR